MGIDIRQGPHQVAQKSNSTGRPRKDSKPTIFPDRSLSSKFGAATTSLCLPLEQATRRPNAKPTAMGMREKGRGWLADQNRIQTLLDFGLRMDANELIDYLAPFEKQQGRDGGNLVAGGHLGVVIGVEFAHLHLAIVFLGKLIDQG